MSDNREAEFLSKMTTGTTHEIRNVFAIIKESAGLLEDMVAAAERGRALQPDRISRSIERIGMQVERGAELMTVLNRFAHSVDHDRERIDLYQEASQVALMCSRMARQKSLRVEARERDKGVGFTANRLLLEMALVTGVECCLAQLPEHGSVVMHSGRLGEAATVDFECDFGSGSECPDPSTAPAWNRLVETIQSLEATIETEGLSCHFQLRFTGD